MGFLVTEWIDRPVDPVWSTLTGWGHASGWMGTSDLDVVGGAETDAIGEGTRLSFEARGQVRESEIASWEPGKHVALRSVQGGMTAVYDYRVEAREGGTQVSLNAECWGGGLLWKLAAPLIGVAMKRADSVQLVRLKAAVEG